MAFLINVLDYFRYIGSRYLSEPNSSESNTNATSINVFNAQTTSAIFQTVKDTLEQLVNIDYSRHIKATYRAIVSRNVYDDFSIMTKNQNNSTNGRGIAKIVVPVINDVSTVCEFEDIAIVCNICLRRVPNRVLIPCGHTFCAQCLTDIGTCPTCRSIINGVMKIYL